jgi:hypothetical protein
MTDFRSFSNVVIAEKLNYPQQPCADEYNIWWKGMRDYTHTTIVSS